MLAYAASRPVAAQRRSSPNTMLVIIAAHVAVVAAVMSAKMDVQRRIFDPPTKIDLINPPPPPPPDDPVRPKVKTTTSVQPLIPLPQPIPDNPIVLPQPINPDPGPIAGPSFDPVPTPTPPKQIVPVRRDPRLLTPAEELKPPYPESKLAAGEEALLKLRLTIDENGRVIAVEPLGRADSVFLAAARRHLIAHWRYKPASEDGRAVTSSIVITLRFQLDA
jgi:protein TonB